MKIKSFQNLIKQNRIAFDIICICIIAIFLSIPMIRKNNDIYLDDGSQHLMRAYGTFKSIKKNGNYSIISDFTNRFGYSWNFFYGAFSTYLIIILSLIFNSFNVGFKFVLCLIILFSGLLMYKFIMEMLENNDVALLTSIVYMISPYFFTDIYVRHAIGESLAFVFMPMVFLGLYNLFNTHKKHYYLIFGAVGLILSHNISTVLVAIISIIYCLVNIKNIFSTRVKKGLIIDFLFILLITSIFWMPFLECKFFTEYQVYEKGAMASRESFLNHRLKLKDLFITGNDTIFVFEIGLPMLMMLVFSVMTLKKIESNKKEYLFFLISGIVSCWMTTKYFPWKLFPESVFIIQFPWRLLIISSFCFAIVCGMNMFTLIKKFNLKDVLIISTICMIYIASRFYVIQYSDNVPRVENYEIPKVTGHNNEWLPGMGRLEYLPTKAYNNSFYIATRNGDIVILHGNCNIEILEKHGSYMCSKILTESENAKIELPYIYYPGYEVRLDGIIQKTYETENGFLGCTLEENESGKLEVEYTGTKIMFFSKIISSISFIVFLIYVWKKH